MKSIQDMKLRYKALILLGAYIIVCSLGDRYIPRNNQPVNHNQLQSPSQLEHITDPNIVSPNEPSSPTPDVVRSLNRYSH